MLKRTFLLLCALFVSLSALWAADPAEEELGRRLAALEGVCETKVLPSGPYAGKYEVMLTQPLDPRRPERGSFRQRVVVMHVGWDRPTVLVTQGYDANLALREKYRDELSVYFDANIVFVEHRYFDRSMPEPCDWRYLTAENSAHDLHRIREVFGALYPGKWIATGVSKGGTTTLLYAAYYPGDVDMYVPYVGPLCTAREDPRFIPFLERVATPDERDAVRTFQRELFLRKERLLPFFREQCTGKGLEFRLPVEEIYDYCVLEYAFSFWQWGLKPDRIPAAGASDREVFDHFVSVSGPEYFVAEGPLTSFFVQAARELGYYPYDLEPFRDCSSLRTTDDYLRRIFLPDELRHTRFSKGLCRKITRYLKREDPRMVLVYGGDDPWTAPGATWAATPDKRNLRVFVEPGGSHLTRIATLPDSLRNEALATLRGWLAEE